MAAKFSLDGAMIPRRVRRMFDERSEERVETDSSTAVLTYNGRNHVVRVGNVSPSGAMVNFPHVPRIGEFLTLQLMERGTVRAEVRWVRDGHIGLAFAPPVE